MSDNKQEILNDTYFLNKYKDVTKKDEFQKDKKITFIVACVCSIVILFVLYVISPYSKTFRVAINNNVYLNDEDIKEVANVNDYFLLNLPSIVSSNVNKHPLIEDSEIELLEGNIVSITVKEVKAIGYIYEDNQSKLLLANDERIILDIDNIYLINKVPLIEGYSKEELIDLEKAISNLDYSDINEISEIHKYPVSYDPTQMEVIMRDGNFCFLSISSAPLLKEYYTISSSIDKNLGHACVYMDDLSNSAYISTCPWQAQSTKTETNEG